MRQQQDGPVPTYDVVETHTSALFFADDRVYKLKKPVRFEFIDLTEWDDRMLSCEREVDLNRRLAPDVYLGVGILGLAHRRPEPVVVMRRLPRNLSLSVLASSGAKLDAEIAAVARVLVDFHRRVRVVGRDMPAAAWTPPPVRWGFDVGELQRLTRGSAREQRVEELDWLARRYTASRGRMFAKRLSDGCVRDGHGDLLASDVFLLTDGPRLLDCLDFDESLRIGDVGQDIAFLAMDLERIGRRDLATSFIAAYEDAAGLGFPPTLLDYYIAQRAVVRAKVGLLRLSQLTATDHELDSDIDAHLDLARSHLQSAQVKLVLIGGLPGSGKTTLADRVAHDLHAVHLSSDAVRKELTHGAATRAAFEGGSYAPAVTERVYAELLRRACDHLVNGRNVVLDATWRSNAHRLAARALARRVCATLSEQSVVVDDRVAECRLRRRRQGLSDADVGIRRAMRVRFDPWPEATAVAGSGARAGSALADQPA